ncbi:MAG: Efflux ABC transporter, permease protein [Parcubacteria group bacterium GW2011_GWA2_51_10]|nr:MAG: Efflux ABC transporter, permease protein [Parcubacteria group bacterium GW2011_GWA2_51_10]
MSLWINIKRVARYGFIGFIRNGFVSLSAVLIMTITLFVVATILISGAALNETLQNLKARVDVSVYFTTNATAEQIEDIKKMLEGQPEVASVTYLDRESALARFRERHKSDQRILQALDELDENPLGASLEVRAKEVSQYEAIAKFLEAQQEKSATTGIDNVNFYQNKTAIDRLTSIIETSNRVGIALALILGLASVLISFNTIRLAIYTSRNEIGVMNIVGAGRWYVRGPFVIAGILYGLVSGLIVLVLLYPFTLYFGPASQRFLGEFNVFTYYASNFALLFLVVMGGGIALGALSSYLAVRRYLRT